MIMLSKVIGDKRRWRQYKVRKGELPTNYRTAIDGVERYLMYFGGGGDGSGWARMLEDLVDLFEQAAANQTPIREIVGKDPAEFVTEFARNYPEGSWITKERKRLNDAIDRAVADADGNDGGSR